jgi:hypothetical protein
MSCIRKAVYESIQRMGASYAQLDKYYAKVLEKYLIGSLAGLGEKSLALSIQSHFHL